MKAVLQMLKLEVMDTRAFTDRREGLWLFLSMQLTQTSSSFIPGAFVVEYSCKVPKALLLADDV
jgi:hypothetical protein